MRCGRHPEPIDEPTPGWEYVENVRYGRSDGPVRVRFPDGPVTTHLLIVPAAGTEVRTGDGVGESLLDRVGLVEGHARTASRPSSPPCWSPSSPARPTSPRLRSEPARDGVRLTVRRGDAIDEITLAWSGEVTVSASGETVLTSKR